MVSMQTLLRAEGVYRFGYGDLFEIIRKYSFQPEIDSASLFAQMTFNALIGNTDDHLKNFTMLHDDHGYYCPESRYREAFLEHRTPTGEMRSGFAPHRDVYP
jgi:hypothetical protein